MSAETVAAPASTRKRDRRPEQTVRKVLDAALEELHQTSFNALTMRMVAARAGVSAASAYTYFPSKSALVAEIYLRLLRDAPVRTDVNQSTRTRVSTTLREMALVVADEPELAAACSAALMADDPAATPIREQIGAQVISRIQSSLGPGWPAPVATTLLMTFAGALMTARFLSFDQIADQLDAAVALVLGESS